MPVPLPSAQSLGEPRVPNPARPLATYQGGIAARAGEAVGEAATRLGETGQQVAGTLQTIADQNAFVTGLQKFQSDNLNIRQAALNDPDYATAPQRYGQQLQAAAQSAASGIRSPDMRARFAELSNRYVVGTQDEIQSHAFAMGKQADRDWTEQYLQGTQDQLASATDDAARTRLLDGAGLVIRSMAAKGSLTGGEAAKLMQQVPQTYALNRARLSAVQDPAGFLGELGISPGGTPSAPATAGGGGFQPTGFDGSAPLADIVAGGRTAELARMMIRGEGGSPAGVVNNPGNVKFAGLPGQIDSGIKARDGGNFASYATPEAGLGAITGLIEHAASGGSAAYGPAPTVASFARTYRGGAPLGTASASSISPEGLGVRAKQGNWTDFIPTEHVPTLALEAQRALHERQTVARGDIGLRYQNTLAALDQGTEPPDAVTPQQIAAAYPNEPERVAAMNDAIAGSRALGHARLGIALTSPAQDDAALTQFQPSASSPDFENAQKRYQALATAIAGKEKSLREDPAGYVLNASPQIGQTIMAADQAMASGADPAQAQAAAAKAVASLDSAYDSLSVPSYARAVLPNARAKDMVGNLLAAPPEQRPAMLSQAAQSWGGAWPRVMGDLVKSGLPAPYQILSVVGPGAAGTALSDAIGNTKIRDALPKQDATDIDTALGDDPNLALLRRSFANMPGGAARAAQVTDALKLMGYGFAARGVSAANAASQAAASVTTDKYDFWENGAGVARLPKGSAAQIETGAETALDKLTPAALAPAVNSGPPAPQSAVQQIALDDAKNGYWVTNASDDGLLRIGGTGRPVTLANGQPFGLKFSDLLRAPPAVAPPKAAAVGAPPVLPMATP